MSYCDFKIGDEVERFRMGVMRHPLADDDGAPIGHVGRITGIGELVGDRFWIEIDTWPVDPLFGMPAEHFRKVQRRDISAWLETPTDFEEPKRAPVTERA